MARPLLIRQCALMGLGAERRPDGRLASGVDPVYLQEASACAAKLRACADGQVRAVLAEQAQAAARDRDDNYVGTEHIVLGIFRAAPNAAVDALLDCAVTERAFEAVLDDEAGPSPEGPIPYTTRAAMIGALAAAAAAAAIAADAGDGTVRIEHLLQGCIAESRRWAELHSWGPHHLCAAAESVGSSLEAIEDSLRPRS